VVKVWTVHATLAEEVRPTQAIYRDGPNPHRRCGLAQRCVVVLVNQDFKVVGAD
jgi:hypothetical protein